LDKNVFVQLKFVGGENKLDEVTKKKEKYEQRNMDRGERYTGSD